MHKQLFLRYLKSTVWKFMNPCLILIGGLTIGLSACAVGGGRIESGGGSRFGDNWQEEVLQHDGHTIVVERSQTYGGGHEIGQRPPIKVLSITFKLPSSGKQFSWTSGYDERIQIADLRLVALHVLADTPYLIVVPNCNSYNKFGRPNPPYVVLKNEIGKWNRITFEELPMEFKATNLVVESLGNSAILADMGKVRAETVRQLNGQMRQPEYRSIIREQMQPSQGVTGCNIARDIRAELIAPEIDGKTIYYNWWPLAKDWMRKTYSTNN
jgi:hypothetical protein